MAARLTVFSPVDPASLDAGGSISKGDQVLDALDDFNHPRQRRALILKELVSRRKNSDNADGDGDTTIEIAVDFQQPPASDLASLHDVYQAVHSEGLLTFLETAWSKWEALGEDGRDPSGYLNNNTSSSSNNDDESPAALNVPPLIPPNVPLPRVRSDRQRPSQHVLGQVGYYCTDTCTPIFGKLKREIEQDAALVRAASQHALQQHAASASSSSSSYVSYILPTHPGHHAGRDSFGGYCYVNHAAALAKNLSKAAAASDASTTTSTKVAILDVDYHCGNGTASIFDDDPTVLVVSLHCDPDHDYPFHSGYADQTGTGAGAGTTLHLPMPPGTTWDRDYRRELERGLDAIVAFQPAFVVVSLGLDTYDKDPCAVRRAGFGLRNGDYVAMGELLARKLADAGVKSILFVQEGGYRMDKVPEAAADVVLSFCRGLK